MREWCRLAWTDRSTASPPNRRPISQPMGARKARCWRRVVSRPRRSMSLRCGLGDAPTCVQSTGGRASSHASHTVRLIVLRAQRTATSSWRPLQPPLRPRIRPEASFSRAWTPRALPVHWQLSTNGKDAHPLQDFPSLNILRSCCPLHSWTAMGRCFCQEPPPRTANASARHNNVGKRTDTGARGL